MLCLTHSWGQLTRGGLNLEGEGGLCLATAANSSFDFILKRGKKNRNTSFPKMLQAGMFRFLVPVSELIYFYSLFIISDDLIITAWGTISLILRQRPIFHQMEYTLTQKTLWITSLLYSFFYKRILLTCLHRHLGWDSVANSDIGRGILSPVIFRERISKVLSIVSFALPWIMC